jgi:predicted permease
MFLSRPNPLGPFACAHPVPISNAPGEADTLPCVFGSRISLRSWYDNCPYSVVRTLIQDLRFGFRMALRSPGFTLIAVLTLAAGIAANSTVFSWIDGVLLHPVPGVADPARLVAFETVAPNGDALTTSYPDYRDYRDHLRLISGLTGSAMLPFNIGQDAHAEHVWGELVTGNYFAVLGVKPILGRMFTPDEYGDAQGSHPVLVISERLWKSRFNADPGAVGQLLRVNRQQLTIVGVVPASFVGSVPGLMFDMWVPVTMGAQLKALQDWSLTDRGTRQMIGLARLRPNVTLEQARSEIQAQARHMAEADPEHNRGISATVLPIWKAHSGAQTALLEPLIILMAVCGVVLMIVCANVANLLLARTTARQREFSVRMAVGAGRGRLVRQLLSENLVLAVLGGLIAVPVTSWFSQSLGGMVPPSGLPVAVDFPLSGDVVAFTFLLCLMACAVSGIAPAWHMARANLNESLKEGGRAGSGGAGSHRIERLLVVSQVALALVAIIGAGLFARSFQAARQISPGFDPSHVLVSHLALNGYAVAERKQFVERLRDRVLSQPGVTAVTYAHTVPLSFSGQWWETLEIQGYVPGPSENMKILRNVVAPGYFDMLRIPLVEGRDFTDHDDEKSAPVMIVSQTFARHFFGGRYPIGQHVHGWGRWFDVVGVAKDSKYETLGEATKPYFYVPFRQVYREDMGIRLYARTAGDPLLAVEPVRRAVRSLDPDAGVFDSMPMAENINAALFTEKLAATMLSVLGGVALLLAALGLYGVMAYAVAERRHEIGIRIALGARPGDVVGMIVRQGMALTLIGLAAGTVVAIAVTRVVAATLVQVSATDPLVFAGALLFLTAVAALASYLPARLAAGIDPNQALRS